MAKKIIYAKGTQHHQNQIKRYRQRINKIPLNKRVALGSKGIKLMDKEHRAICQYNRRKKK